MRDLAGLFIHWSSFSRHVPSPCVSNSCGFSLYYVDRKQWAFFYNARLFPEDARLFRLKLRTLSSINFKNSGSDFPPAPFQISQKFSMICHNSGLMIGVVIPALFFFIWPPVSLIPAVNFYQMNLKKHSPLPPVSWTTSDFLEFWYPREFSKKSQWRYCFNQGRKSRKKSWSRKSCYTSRYEDGLINRKFQCKEVCSATHGLLNLLSKVQIIIFFITL
jgi:hypothetical protein